MDKTTKTRKAEKPVALHALENKTFWKLLWCDDVRLISKGNYLEYCSYIHSKAIIILCFGSNAADRCEVTPQNTCIAKCFTISYYTKSNIFDKNKEMNIPRRSNCETVFHTVEVILWSKSWGQPGWL